MGDYFYISTRVYCVLLKWYSSRKEAVKRGFTMVDVDNNPSTDLAEDDLLSKGEASYESAWIAKLLGDSEDEEEAGLGLAAARGQSRHNSCHQQQDSVSRQDSTIRLFTFLSFLYILLLKLYYYTEKFSALKCKYFH